MGDGFDIKQVSTSLSATIEDGHVVAMVISGSCMAMYPDGQLVDSAV